jgi:hypothetical protein
VQTGTRAKNTGGVREREGEVRAGVIASTSLVSVMAKIVGEKERDGQRESELTIPPRRRLQC